MGLLLPKKCVCILHLEPYIRPDIRTGLRKKITLLTSLRPLSVFTARGNLSGGPLSCLFCLGFVTVCIMMMSG